MCLGGEKRGQAGRPQLFAASWPSPAPCAFPGGALARRPAPRPTLPGNRAARVVEGARTGVGTLGAQDRPGPYGPCTLGKLLRPWASVSRPARGEGRPERSNVPSARTPCARNLAAGGSLTLAAALYSGKCLGLPEPPLRSQVAGGEASEEGARTAAGRTNACC